MFCRHHDFISITIRRYLLLRADIPIRISGRYTIHLM